MPRKSRLRMTAPILGESASFPDSAWINDAETSVWYGDSPVAASRPASSARWSNSVTIVWRIWASVSFAPMKYVSGQVRPSTPCAADLHASCRTSRCCSHPA